MDWVADEKRKRDRRDRFSDLPPETRIRYEVEGGTTRTGEIRGSLYEGRYAVHPGGNRMKDYVRPGEIVKVTRKAPA